MGATSGIRVLHVDDEPDFADLTAVFLERGDARFTVETATSADAGLERIDSAEFDCIVSDYEMPGPNGIEFLRAVREDYPDLPFILFTGKGSETVASDAISAGVTDYLQKESGTEQYEILANRIRNAVERTRAQRGRQRHLNAIETAQEGISILDKDAEFVYANEAYADLYGYRPEDMIGEKWDLTYRDEDISRVREQILPVVESDGYWHGEMTGLRADGSTFVGDHTLSRTDEGEFVCTVRDISEHKEREQELREEREFIDQALNALEDVFYVVRSDGKLRRWNERLSEITGYTDDEIGDIDVIDFFPEDHHQLISEAHEEVLTTGYTVVEADLLTKSGERIPFEFAGSLLTDLEDDPIGLLGIGRDIRDRRAYEQKLTALHDVTDSLTTCESVEQVCERTIDASKDVLAFDLSVIDIEDAGLLKPIAVSEDLPSEDLTSMAVDEGIAGKTYQTGESFVIDDIEAYDDANSQGQYRSGISVPIDDHGVFQAVAEAPGAFGESDLELAELLLSHTASALDRLAHEEQLHRQNERLEQFVNVVSHDLRNPLNIAQARLTLAREECVSAHLDEISRAHERMETLIQDLLTLALDGEHVDETEPIIIGELISGCWRNVETTDATLVTEAEQTIHAGPSRLKQLLENLFRNAVEHGDQNVTVRVGDLEDGFYVADDGPGIPEDDREEVFEPGYSTETEGIGFGLHIVREIVEAHDWDIRVTDSESGGARFEITGVENE
ncbi:MAG: PAS domain S-box protein [Halapricum sp.]